MSNPTEDGKTTFESSDSEEEVRRPDPDEELVITSLASGIIMVKMPKVLLERWLAVKEEEVHLATLRRYEPDPKDDNSKPRYFLFLPPNRDPVNAPTAPLPPSAASSRVASGKSTPIPQSSGTSTPVRGASDPISFVHPEVTDWPSFEAKPGDSKPYKIIPTQGTESDIYDLDVVEVNQPTREVKSILDGTVKPPPLQLVVATSEKKPHEPGYTRKHFPYPVNSCLVGKIGTQGILRQPYSHSFRMKIRDRNWRAHQPKRVVKVMKMEDLPSKKYSNGKRKMVEQGFLRAATPSKSKDRMFRLSRDEVLDTLFNLFQEKGRWNLKDLRQRSQQPEAWLKEVLREVADPHATGTFRGLWELKPIFKMNSKAEDIQESLSSVASGSGSSTKKEEKEEDVVEDDDDEDWEELA